MVLRAGFKKKLRLYVELKIYDKNRRKITGPQCVNTGKSYSETFLYMQTTRLHIPYENKPHSHGRGSLKFHICSLI
jgi:hypothetical protein